MLSLLEKKNRKKNHHYSGLRYDFKMNVQTYVRIVTVGQTVWLTRQTDRQMDGWMDGWMLDWLNVWTDSNRCYIFTVE